ncbi:MAG: tRNA dihydrouridine(20/20a) synthase DusA [Gammaproteobacteria bacterium]
MMDRTDRHCRYLLRLLSRHVWLYTEMLHVNALLQGDAARHLRYDASEHPLALQLGGSDPRRLARGAHLVEDHGYDEVNLNVGCPSERVREGRFGACLMAEPERVADCVAAMRAAVRIPVTVKTRLGIDERDSYELLCRFVEQVAAAGCRVFILHARKAWLQGLSPRQNRTLPPLRYELVHQLKRDLPDLELLVNGGITDLDQVEAQLHGVDGVMIGREAYRNPYLLTAIDGRFYADPHPIPTREAVVTRYQDHILRERARGTALSLLARPALGLFRGQAGARRWRRELAEALATGSL